MISHNAASVASTPVRFSSDSPPTQIAQDGKRLLFHFIEEFLQIELVGLQSNFGVRPDSLLFVGPHGSTLSVPIDTLLEPRDIALEIIRSKVESSHRQFAGAK